MKFFNFLNVASLKIFRSLRKRIELVCGCQGTYDQPLLVNRALNRVQGSIYQQKLMLSQGILRTEVRLSLRTKSGSLLSFHTVASTVLSAASVLTIVFGMGTGVAPKRIATGNV